MPHSPGQILNNRYRIVKLLGQGGFGAVYRVWDINLERPLALKENLDVSQVARRQFKREAQILFDLAHPNLPRVIDHFVTSFGQYLVMEYVEGEDLQQMLDRTGGPLLQDNVMEWIGQICDALAYLHNQNPPIIHRDIKPANIKIAPASIPSARAKAMLVDFGIAKVYDPGVVTTIGARAVTPGYSPPEQYGQGATDTRSDIYSLGATCYSLLTGQKPPDSIDMMAAQRNPPLVHTLNPLVPSHTSLAIERAMQLDVNARFATVGDFKAAIRVGRLPTIAQPTPQPFKGTGAQRSKGLHKVYLLSTLAGLVGLLIFVFGLNFLIRSLALPTAENTPSTETAVAGLQPRATGEIATPSGVPTETDAAELPVRPGATRLSQVDGMEMVYIPEGEFLMGATDVEAGLSFDQTPQHQVALSAYWIDLFEVSNGMYQDCVDSGTCRAPVTSASSTRKYYYDNPDYADFPVVWVTWDDASTYCRWAGRRLPSEAEWERAARGENGLSYYPWGSDPPNGDVANFCDVNCSLDWQDVKIDDGFEDTAPVDFYISGASIYGLLNMAGNVWEWVLDFYDKGYYRISPFENPFGPDACSERVLRGGSYESSARDIRAVNRFYFSQDAATSSFGFRCVADAE